MMKLEDGPQIPDKNQPWKTEPFSVGQHTTRPPFNENECVCVNVRWELAWEGGWIGLSCVSSLVDGNCWNSKFSY